METGGRRRFVLHDHLQKGAKETVLVNSHHTISSFVRVHAPSYYIAQVEKIVDQRGNWNWLNNVITGESITATEALIFGKKFAVLFQRLGLDKGDVIHLVVGNFNLSFSACFGIWILGGITSVGDVNLEARAIALQVWKYFCRVLSASFITSCS